MVKTLFGAEPVTRNVIYFWPLALSFSRSSQRGATIGLPRGFDKLFEL